MSFVKAERKRAKLKIALTGPSGAGKTLSALLLASALGKKIALIDTENGSASLYADHKEFKVPEFDVMDIDPPYTVQKYQAGIKAAQEAGYDVLIIDSLSHAWAGEGGLLAKKESLDARGGNSFSNWGSISKEHESFKSWLLNCDIHLIATMRSKQDYVLEVNEKGKSTPRKVGLAPIQREGMEYEFTTVFDVAMDHAAVASKDRTGLFDGVIEKISEKTGEAFVKWLSGAKMDAKSKPAPQDAAPAARPPVQPNGTAAAQTPPASNGRKDPNAPATDKQRKMIWAKLKNELSFDDDQARAFITEHTGKESGKDLTMGDVDKLVSAIDEAAAETAHEPTDFEKEARV